MKQRIKELGDAINESLSSSDQIAEVIGRIKEDGYDVFLVLEATVGFNRKEAEGEEPLDNVTEITSQEEPELKVNAQDMRFLKSLRISVDDAA
jgi:hypothetical protein